MSGVLDPEGAHLAGLRRLADFAEARVVEVGCGDGRPTIGADASARAVDRLIARGLLIEEATDD